MTKNEGNGDRLIRLVLGLVLLAPIGVYGASVGSGVAAAAGLVMLVTGALGTCPIYRVLGVSTRRAS